MNVLRTKIAKTLLDFGDRVQYSVFESKLDKNLLDKLVLKLIEIIEESEDSIRVYPLCAVCETGISVLGQGKIMKEEDIYIL
ncbi:MAG: CRISPR-associated endonuclease Cas2 [Desulfobacterales bacterium S5133MH4]|nr:MAG: CRISPR-associated endonuclease Cas2 [Desulfobacterales bacterium S5133MH4]